MGVGGAPVTPVDKQGNVIGGAANGPQTQAQSQSFTPSYLPNGTDRSGSATTTSGGLAVAANANRTFLVGQNVSTVNIGFNEQGGTAAIGSAGTYTVSAGSPFSISTNKAVNFISAGPGNAAVTMTEG